MRLWTADRTREPAQPSGRPVASEKAPDAFRTISEVADDLDVPQHVLRFWETRFGQIKPLKRGGGRRYYRPEDVDLLRGIKHLLYGEGYTIKGVQRILKSQGQKFVQSVWRDPGSLAAAVDRNELRADDEADEADDTDADVVETAEDVPHADPVRSPAPPAPPAPALPPADIRAEPGRAAGPEPAARVALAGAAPAPAGRLVLRPADDERDAGVPRLTREKVQALQAALFELSEARRILATRGRG